MSEPPTRIELTLRRGNATEQRLVHELPATIGRRDCAIAVDDPAISRRHCRIGVSNGRLLLQDLDSQNGTWRGNERIQQLELEPGSTFRAGNTEFEVGVVRLADPSLAGGRLGGYELRRVLGRGGSGTVYLAHHLRLDREDALKVLDTRESSHADIAAFEREARAAAALDHPRLVRVHDIAEAGGVHYLAMELAPGGSVAARIRESGPLPWREAVAVALDVVEALEHAHGSGFVHGDVKPANVLLDADGRAKLADLGLVHGIDGSGARAAGTVAFLSPEQILRKSSDARSDLYALGCTLFMMLTGRRVFPRKSVKEIAAAHARDPAPALAEAGADVPPDLEYLVEDLLRKDPDARPQTAAEVGDRLRAIRSQSSLPAPRRRSRRMRSTRTGPSGAHVVLYLLVLAALVALAFWLAKR